MCRICNWLESKSFIFFEYLSKNNADVTPSPSFWIFLSFLRLVQDILKPAIKKLQGKDVLVSQQREILKKLWISLGELVQMEFELTEEDIALTNLSSYILFEDQRIKLLNIKNLMADRGRFVSDKLDTLDETTRNNIYKDIAFMLLEMVSEIKLLVAERDEQNRSSDEQVLNAQANAVVNLRGIELTDL